jgi:hypothetical protein
MGANHSATIFDFMNVKSDSVMWLAVCEVYICIVCGCMSNIAVCRWAS